MILFEDKNFKIKRTSRDYVLIRKNAEYSQHAHFKKRFGCDLIIKLFNKNMKPTKRYFAESMRRVTTQEEFENLRVKKRKQSYYNTTGRGR